MKFCSILNVHRERPPSEELERRLCITSSRPQSQPQRRLHWHMLPYFDCRPESTSGQGRTVNVRCPFTKAEQCEPSTHKEFCKTVRHLAGCEEFSPTPFTVLLNESVFEDSRWRHAALRKHLRHGLCRTAIAWRQANPCTPWQRHAGTGAGPRPLPTRHADNVKIPCHPAPRRQCGRPFSVSPGSRTRRR